MQNYRTIVASNIQKHQGLWNITALATIINVCFVIYFLLNGLQHDGMNITSIFVLYPTVLLSIVFLPYFLGTNTEEITT